MKIYVYFYKSDKQSAFSYFFYLVINQVIIFISYVKIVILREYCIFF